ncbi:hypothetical protein [Clostridium luticellarii]|uniref:hypothetical protein n=1 Tax=Clostridium luticellarii TaxID=1691940 RepID=UPI0023563206|nr:hypothetical protein [Clostridium luticellarii]MCI1995873.1 hypothetical protein [Clostridium luticellarii]
MDAIMKKIIIVLLFLTVIGCIVIFSNRGYYKNDYTGKYECPKNNVLLILSANNNCTLINTLSRGAVYIEGKYSIEDNGIKLILNEGSSGSYRKIYLNGRIKGHSIELYNFYNNGTAVFYLKNRFVLFK